MTCRFFKKKEWLEVIDGNCQERILKTDCVSVAHLESIRTNKSLIFITPSVVEKVPYDGFQWTKSKDGKRVQPQYRKLALNDVSHTIVQCIESSNSSFRKEVLHLSERTIIHYFMEGDGEFEIPDTRNLKKPRLGGAVSLDLKLNILPKRTSSAAYAIAQDKGYEISRKQIHNVKRYVFDAIDEKSGRKVVTTLKDVRDLASVCPENVQYFVSQSNELVFGYTHIYDDAMRIFAAGCPNISDYNEWTDSIDILNLKPLDVMKKHINELLSKDPSGVIFSSRLFVDTTFNLSDSYVTCLLGESGNFRTKASGKPRVFPIGYLIHSHKETSHHQFFADIIHEAIQKYLADKAVPCVLMDGEQALQVYSDAFSSNIIRCDWHVTRLLSQKFGKKASTTADYYLYGNKDVNGKWRSGLFGSFTKDQFLRRLEKIKNQIDPRIHTWLSENKGWLFETATTIPKLKAGLILQYATTNPSENFNKQLKTVIQKPFPLPKLLQRLDSFCQEKLDEMRKAAVGESDLVVLYQKIERFNDDQRENHFKSIGLACATLLSYDPPRNLMKGLDYEKCDKEEYISTSIRIISKTGDTYVLENDSILPNMPNRVTVVTRIQGILTCSTCGRTLPQFICQHLLTCFKALPSLDRKVEFWRLDDAIRGDIAITVPQKSGKKPSTRVGSRISSNNHVRQIAEVSDLSIFNSSHNSTTLRVSEEEDDFSNVNLNHSYESESETTQNACGSSSSISFSPIFTSTKISEESTASMRRTRRSTRRYSPEPSTSSAFDYN